MPPIWSSGVLSALDVVNYLAKHKLISLESIVEGNLSVSDASSRNQNFRIVTKEGPSYFFKHATEPDTSATLFREAISYRHFFNSVPYGGFQNKLLKYYHYDQKKDILILELLPNSLSLRDHYTKVGRFSKLLATEMGIALAELHLLTETAEVKKTLQQGFAADLPWILSIHRPRFELIEDVSAANFKLIRAVQKFVELSEVLERLRSGWRNDHLIHFDIKADNWLVLGSATGERRHHLKLVDWELTRMGDACWDVGSVIADYLSHWLFSIPIAGAPPDQYLSLSHVPLVKIQPAVGAFWKSYSERMSLQTSADQWLDKSVRYAAIRLLQRSYEQMQRSSELTSNVVCVLQVSQNMLQRPIEAAVRLLKLPLTSLRI